MSNEYNEQVKLTHYLNILKQQKKIIEFFSIVNENNTYQQNRKYAMINEQKLKATGKKKGVSDMCVVLKDRVLFVEMKRSPKVLKSGKLSIAGINVSKEQEQFLATTQQSEVVNGSICYGFNQAKEYIEKFL